MFRRVLSASLRAGGALSPYKAHALVSHKRQLGGSAATFQFFAEEPAPVEQSKARLAFLFPPPVQSLDVLEIRGIPDWNQRFEEHDFNM